MTELSHLNLSSPSYTQRRSLPALASTCRAFKHPALNALWRDLQSVKPLVKCLPSDRFGVGHKGAVVSQKPLDDGMWATLFEYTSRVHSITVSESDNLAIIEPLCMLMLSCSSAPASLFPNLSKLQWRGSGTHCAAEFLRMAFVPSLVELDMQISIPSFAFLSVLSSLGSSCPHLHNMTMNVRSASDGSLLKISPFILRPISQLYHLHSLSVWDLGIQSIKHYMELRALQSLSLDLTTSSESTWDTKLLPPLPGFHNLKLLDLSTCKVEHASNFLSSFEVVRSKEIKVKFADWSADSSGSESTMISQFFAIVQERCDNDKLEIVSLDGVFSRQATNRNFLRPLHACHNLTRLLVGRVCDISMSDKELCQLAIAWPKLQLFQIQCYAADKTKPTFRGLIDLLRRCPALTSLVLAIDTTQLKGIDLRCPGGGIRNKHIKFLALGISRIEAPVDVALIISGLFPYLKKVDLDCWDTRFRAQQQSEMEQWALVNSIIGGFSVVRERGIEASDC
ncbi:hypothetical protein DEU56DRAFT_981123 [Suillus clintonianus]|uniref:uncharacterized protein n=1 Tax=Suillus clintonianus TaxID=1904413 RepID=UPI001B85D140|nr:uncharacterized protein DEU56DRAFT_981123 [Suillus clintonianus]KAG2135501.1 hypothetical protein DEU56DRAFT_981123 [Suillus clintonianus]